MITDKRRFSSPVYLFICLLLSSLGLFAAPYPEGGIEIKYKQPNGTAIELLVTGSNYYSRILTKDGFTVVMNPLDNTYYYARFDKQTNELVPTHLMVGRDVPVGIAKNIKLPEAIRKQKWDKVYQERNAESIKRWQKRVKAANRRRANKNKAGVQQDEAAGADGTQNLVSPDDIAFAPVNGDKKGLTILVQFPDDPNTAAVDAVNFPTDQAKIQRYCNDLGYVEDGNSGSIRDYFRDQSLNALDYTMLVSPIITLPNPKNYYNYSDYPANQTIRQSGAAGRLIITEAITALTATGFDYSGLTIKSGNQVLSTNLLYAGSRPGVTEGLWPHRWFMAWQQVSVTINGQTRYIRDYQITDTPNNAPRIGTFVHESGHLLLDYPDLYDTNGGSNGIGRHGLMAAGSHVNSGRTPSPINLYFKDIVGWANIVELSANTFTSVSLPTTGNVGYRIKKPGTDSEYFLVENRGAGDKWSDFAPDKGIMIWHVDQTVSGNNDQQMTSAQHYQISLEQSDNRFDLENESNRGDDTDLYDSATPLFDDNSTPNAKWWDGVDSGVKVRVLSSVGASMQVEFGTIQGLVMDAPNGGETLGITSTTKIKWHGAFAGNVKIQLYQNGQFIQTIASNEPNDGSYIWNLAGNFPVGSGYSIKITSLDDPSVNDSSNGTFSLMKEQFVAAGIFPAGWVKTASADKGWIVANDEAAEGSYSLKNTPINDDQTASVEYTGDFQAGSITFKAKVSSEAAFDYLRFYIDGIEQDINPTVSYRKALTGEIDWSSLTFPVTAGNHTFKWSYIKDDSEAAGRDTAWIDGVVLPDEILTGIAAWKDEHFSADAGNDAIAGDAADPDNDGISNFLEYAFHLNPKVSDKIQISMEISGSVTTLVYQRNSNATDLNYIIESSEDMKTWTTVTVAEQVTSTENGIETIQAPYVMGNKIRIFLRVRVAYK